MLIFIRMLRIVFLAVVLMSGLAVNAQTDSSFGAMNRWESGFKRPPAGDTNNIHKKWFVTKYAGVSAGFVAFKGGGGSFLSVPLSLQLNRQLTNNLFAFGAVSAAPMVFRTNSAFYQPAMKGGNSWSQQNNFSAWSDARIGVMYISNDKTFSISGSVGVGRGTYNGYSPFYSPMSSPVFSPMGGHGQW
ncbi:MAG: hypothetical protein J7623_25940 [Chitinophaga sp.]|uniref:hypothetical protein n=1 Tax=Chitinophaga sp. TaxID=1869181 RepID=UPI001B259CB5|nr:hypothetical protein [Chitinophaga sp.]MBO9732109.1 hypothetical protein [Chitinophaga sp.]